MAAGPLPNGAVDIWPVRAPLCLGIGAGSPYNIDTGQKWLPGQALPATADAGFPQPRGLDPANSAHNPTARLPAASRAASHSGTFVKFDNLLARYHRLVLFFPLFVAYVAVLFLRCELGDLANLGHDLVRLLGPLLELGLASLACALCVRKARQGARVAWLAAGALIAAVACVAYFAQIVSLYLSNNFITVLALKNTDSAGFVSSPWLRVLAVAVMAVFALFVLGMIRSSARGEPAPMVKRRGKSAGFALLVVLLLNLWLLGLQQKHSDLEAAFWQAPVTNLAHNLYVAQFGREQAVEDEPVADGMRCFAYPEGVANRGYPFQKASTYTAALPFETSDRAVSRPNVIVVFAEGTSSRLVGAYGGRYPGLTPNIDRLAGQSLQVEDYFNHTAATYRGLIGQLSSGYAYAGGGGGNGWERGDNKSALSAIRRRTLPRILGEQGYDSYFFSPHLEDRPFTLMLRSLGFDKVYTYQSIGKGLLEGHFRARDHTGALEDESLFAGIVKFLQQRAGNGAQTPFFLATYNIGTHAFIDINDEGDVAYRDGDKAFLNKLHNYDAALGRFLDYFYASPFAQNTILVFTSDHATYPDPMYRAVAGDGLKPYFVDRIPLLIRDPIHDLPARLDAHGRNSLDLAPTVLQLLGLRQTPNSFLGHSLFEPRNFPLGIAALGNQYFLTTSQGVFARNDVPGQLKAQFECETRVVRKFYAAEKDNRLFGQNGSLARQ